MSEYKDITGQDLNVGDRIAYATSQSNSVEMKLGTITELVPQKLDKYEWMQPVKIRVQVEETSARWGTPAKPVLITKLERVVKL